MMIREIVLCFAVVLACKSAIIQQNSASRRGSYTFSYKPTQSTSSQNLGSSGSPSTNYNSQYSSPYSTQPATPNLGQSQSTAQNSAYSTTSQNSANSYYNNNNIDNQNLNDVKELFDQIMRTRGMYLANTDYSNPSSLTYRLSVFKNNVDKINLHNSQPGVTYKMEVNRFTALTSEQFRAAQLTGSNAEAPAEIVVSPIFVSFNSLDMSIVPSIDWKGSGKLTPVKDQGKCGACWAFSALATLQAYVSIQTGAYPESLSEQQLIDCAFLGQFGSNPCGGAWPETAYNHISLSGIAATRDYPYTGNRQACREKSVPTKKYIGQSSVYGTVTGLTNVLFYLSRGPLAVAIDATSWQFYSEGILNCPRAQELNHAATLVGFNLANMYWTIKNSWGADWGEGGYIRLDAVNNCAVLSYAFYPFAQHDL